MAYWLIKIKGDQLDLLLLERLFFSKSVSSVREDESYYLQIQNTSDQADLSQIKAEADHVIDIVNGSARLYHNRFQKTSLDVNAYLVNDDGTRQAFGFLTAKATDYTITAFSTNFDATLSNWVDNAVQNMVIGKVLSLYGSL
jgi:hypothetical protein